MVLLRLIFLYLVTFSLVALIGCGSGTSSDEATGIPKIVNGIFTEGKFPEVTQLYINRGSILSACTGTWIGKHTLLTAAHCVFDQTNQIVAKNAVIAFSSLNENFSSQESISVIPHPNYFPENYIPSSTYPNLLTNAYDIALVIFDQPFLGTPAIISSTPPAIGDLLTIVGYGSHGYGDTQFGTAYLGYTSIDNLDELRIFWKFDGGNESNTCFGDSGGPAYIDFGYGPRLIGTTSAGTSRYCSEGDISIDMRIDAYLDWIKSVAGDDLTITNDPITRPIQTEPEYEDPRLRF